MRHYVNAALRRRVMEDGHDYQQRLRVHVEAASDTSRSHVYQREMSFLLFCQTLTPIFGRN